MYTEKSLQSLETLEEIKEILTQASFPCSRDDILKCAKDAQAPKRVMKILEMLPDPSKKFQGINEIMEYLDSRFEIND